MRVKEAIKSKARMKAKNYLTSQRNVSNLRAQVANKRPNERGEIYLTTKYRREIERSEQHSTHTLVSVRVTPKKRARNLVRNPKTK